MPGKSTKIGGRWFSASASPLTRQPFPCLYSGCANCISKLPGKPTLEQSQSKPLTRQKIIRTKNNKASSLATITYPARVLPIEKNPNNIVFLPGMSASAKPMQTIRLFFYPASGPDTHIAGFLIRNHIDLPGKPSQAAQPKLPSASGNQSRGMQMGERRSRFQSSQRRADAQQLVTTRLLDCVHDPAGQLSRLQRIQSYAW